MINRALVATLAVALGISAASTVDIQAAHAAPSSSAAAERATTATRATTSTVRRIRWTRCADATLRRYSLRCGTLRVPLDYRHPNGATITLALTIRRHTSSAGQYLGPILTNPGGPGGSGLTLPILQNYVPNGVGTRFDWIGFDPRGVGQSRPALNCDPSYNGYDRPSYEPTTPALMHYWRSRTRAYARACGTADARRLLPHMTTADNARDMNSIRKALGVRKISYYGFSWGSYLGQDFLTLFPNRVKRVVLDGVVDPSRVWYRANLDQDVHFDANMDVFWKWVAANDDVYHLGTDWTALKSGFYAERRHLVDHPAAGGKLGPDELTDVMLDAGYYVIGWAQDAAAYASLINDGDGTALLKAYRDGNVGAGAENGFAVYNAVQCTDTSWPDWATTLRDTRRVAAKAPFMTWSNTWFNAPCLNWPVASHHRVNVRQRRGVPRFLLVSESKDAATPYSGALAVRARFPRARLIEGVGGTTHAASLWGVRCVDDTIAHYLATGAVPKRRAGYRPDRECPALAPPAASTGAARQAPRLPAIVRDALRAAQRYELH
ncbi:alpha/beta fold hydrolase [Nocardioides ultimimeridianus]